jgi:branched-chain amino acid transport system ATP-binding protein
VPEILLQARNLSITFGGLKAVQDVSLDVPQGSLTALVGPNGAGKTTLFGLLSGFLKPGAGSVHFAGARRWPRPKRSRRGSTCKLRWTGRRPT